MFMYWSISFVKKILKIIIENESIKAHCDVFDKKTIGKVRILDKYIFYCLFMKRGPPINLVFKGLGRSHEPFVTKSFKLFGFQWKQFQVLF